jgi:hypothetical protein
MDRSAGVLWIVSEVLFLRSSGIHSNLSTTRERLPRTGTICRKRTSGVRGLCGKRTCHVDRVFPCRVYINSNRPDSRI